MLPAFLDRIARRGRPTRRDPRAQGLARRGSARRRTATIPPLDYELVLEMKRAFPDLHISVNGGIETLDQAEGFLAQGLDGVMIGRAAYHTPAAILLDADARIWGDAPTGQTAEDVVRAMLPYIERHLAEGGRLNQVTRHMLGLFAGRPGARAWRRILSEGAHRPGADARLVETALSAVPPQLSGACAASA